VCNTVQLCVICTNFKTENSSNCNQSHHTTKIVQLVQCMTLIWYISIQSFRISIQFVYYYVLRRMRQQFYLCQGSLLSTFTFDCEQSHAVMFLVIDIEFSSKSLLCVIKPWNSLRVTPHDFNSVKSFRT